MQKLGYARVSTDSQSLNRQMDMLREYGVDRIFSEKMTGTKASRPELDRLRETMRAGDQIVVESLSRLGRSSKDLLNLLDEFDRKGVKFISLKERIDTTTPTGKLLITVLSAISQFERDLIVQRTQEGLKAARARGRIGGRPRVDGKKISQAVRLYQTQTMSVNEIAKTTGVSASSLYRYLRNVSSVEI